MGAFDKFLDILKIDNSEDDYYDSDYYEEDAGSSEKVSFLPSVKNEADGADDKPAKRAVRNNSPKKRGLGNMEVVRIEPTNIEDGRKISELLLENKVVFLDLEGIDMNLAQRIIDFVSGASFAIDGTLQQMSKYTFVIAPPAVNVSGDFSENGQGNTQVIF